MMRSVNIEVKYVGKHIRIGVAPTNGHVYFQPLHLEETKFWFRFDPAYYQDYEEFLHDYDEAKNLVD